MTTEDESGPLATAGMLSVAMEETLRRLSHANHQDRSDPYGPSVSAFGLCTRQAAYRVGRVDPSDPELAWEIESLSAYRSTRTGLPTNLSLGNGSRSAVLGTILHQATLPTFARVLAEQVGGEDHPVVEQPVSLVADDLTIPGRLDIYVPEVGLVVDLKTVFSGQLGRRHAPADRELVQVGGYGLALRQQGYPVRELAWLYMDRSSGRTKEIRRPFDREVTAEVRRRTFGAIDWAQKPDSAPRWHDGPGLSWVCDSCPWLRRCWGPRAVPGRTGPQGQLARTDEAVDELLAEGARLAIIGSKVKKRRDAIKSAVTGEDETGTPRRPGDYGEYGFKLGKPSEALDQREAVRRLEQAGIEVPYNQTTGRFHIYQTGS